MTPIGMNQLLGLLRGPRFLNRKIGSLKFFYCTLNIDRVQNGIITTYGERGDTRNYLLNLDRKWGKVQSHLSVCHFLPKQDQAPHTTICHTGVPEAHKSEWQACHN